MKNFVNIDIVSTLIFLQNNYHIPHPYFQDSYDIDQTFNQQFYVCYVNIPIGPIKIESIVIVIIFKQLAEKKTYTTILMKTTIFFSFNMFRISKNPSSG